MWIRRVKLAERVNIDLEGDDSVATEKFLA